MSATLGDLLVVVLGVVLPALGVGWLLREDPWAPAVDRAVRPASTTIEPVRRR